jgi:hypothetical protein
LKDRKTPKSKNLLFGGAGFSTNPNQTPMLRNKSELENVGFSIAFQPE